MFSRRFLLALLACLLLPVPAARAADKKMRIMFVTQSKGFVHSSVKRTGASAGTEIALTKPGERPEFIQLQQALSAAEIALTQLGATSGQFEVDCTQDCEADFTKENLQKYDIVAFYTTGDLPISDADRDYFFNAWLKEKGHGVLGFHSAMDTLKNYEPYWDMIGGTFLAHPWGSGTEVTITNLEPENPLTKSFGDELKLKEEIYMYEHWQPAKVHVLMSLDYSKSPVKNAVPTQFGYHVPVCWIKNYGEGRVYCNNLGHNETTWTNPQYLDSIVAAVKWIRGDFDVDATPNPAVSAQQEAKAQFDFQAGAFTDKK